ncbi:unnamed protein product [Prunus armeniaca]|uniref:Uncharacterized protein n=1 Tax=Prunus armeniaca TaxID=36596 RepID=A0A6J5Y881_PRUAR|nr:unnamed protein product [Prunus armeniaca]
MHWKFPGLHERETEIDMETPLKATHWQFPGLHEVPWREQREKIEEKETEGEGWLYKNYHVAIFEWKLY